jgi:hypothetical protein
MALTEFEAARVKKVVGAFIEERRPPPDIRSKVDLGYRLSGQSVEIFEIRRFGEARLIRNLSMPWQKRRMSEPGIDGESSASAGT